MAALQPPAHADTASHATGKPGFAPKPGLAQWLAVLSVAIGAFAMVTTEFLPVGLLPQIARELGITEGQAGLTVTMPGLLGAIAAPLIGVVAGRLDRRHLLLILMAMLVVSNAIVALSDNFLVLLFGRLLLGIGVGGFWVVGVAVGPRLVPDSYAVRATSLIFAGVSLGTVAGVPAGSLVGDLIGWRASFWSGAGIAFLVSFALYAWLPSLPMSRANTFRDLLGLVFIPKARLGLIATVLLFIGQFGAYTYISPFLIQISGMSVSMVTVLLLVYGLTGFAGNIGGGWVAGRSALGALVGTSGAIALILLAFVTLGGNAIAAGIIVGLWGLAFGALPISTQTWMFRAAPQALESGAGLFVATAQASLASGALVGGVAVDHLGVSSAMVLGIVFTGLTALVVFAFGRGPMAVAEEVAVLREDAAPAPDCECLAPAQ